MKILYYLEIDDCIIDISDNADSLCDKTKESFTTKSFVPEYDSRLYVATGRTILDKFFAIKAITNEDTENNEFLFSVFSIAKSKGIDLNNLKFVTATGKII